MTTPCRICHSDKLGNVHVCLDCIEQYKELVRLLNDALPYLEANADDVNRLVLHGDEEGERELAGILDQIKEIKAALRKAQGGGG